MKSKSIVLMVLMMSALILAAFNGGLLVPQVTSRLPVLEAPSGPFLKYGPRVDKLIFVVGGEEEEIDAGLVDIMSSSCDPARWNAWFADPAVTMAEFQEFAVIYLALNTARWPLGHGDQLSAGWTYFPTNWKGTHSDALWKRNELWVEAVTENPYYEADQTTPPGRTGTADWCYVDYENCGRCRDARQFRRGLAHLANRDDQIAYMAGEGAALPKSLLYEPLRSFWENPNTPTYEFSLQAASDAFVAGGFKDWDGDKVMEYSPGHDGAVVEELPVIEWYTNVESDHRQHLSLMIDSYMQMLMAYPCGAIPHKVIIATYEVIDEVCWFYYDYDVYVEYWDWGATPDFYAEWFASFGDIFPAGYANNYHRYHSKEFDQYADAFMTAPSPEGALGACYDMQTVLHTDAVAIPYYQYVGYVPSRTWYGTWPGETKYAGKNWTDMCVYPGEGTYTFTGGWTQFNVHPQGFEKGGTLRVGLGLDPLTLDVVDSWYFYDHMVLTQIYETLLRPNPWDPCNVSAMIPWLCSSYKVGTWEKPGVGPCTAMNFTLIPGVLWQDGTPMTAEDVGWSFWFYREVASIQYPKARNFDNYVIYPNTPEPGIETIELRFSIRTWLAPAWVNGLYGCYILPKHIWEPIGPAGSPRYVPEDHDTVIGTGPFRFYKDKVVGRVDRIIGEYVYLEPNPLYFRKYIWPDVCDADGNLPGDEQVTGMDFAVVAYPINIFVRENPDGTWPAGTWGEPCDVNKDGKIGVGDLMEIGVNYGDPWPPAYYEW